MGGEAVTANEEHPAVREHHGRIVVGIDGSPSSRLALRWTFEHAVRTGAQVAAVACWDWPTMSAGYHQTAPGLFERAVADLQTMVAEVVEQVPGGAHVPVSQDVVKGYPPRVLVERSRGADLLVVGSRGRSGMNEVLLGSVGLHCATHAACPVLIMREPARGS